jgi:hypothetical protein
LLGSSHHLMFAVATVNNQLLVFAQTIKASTMMLAKSIATLLYKQGQTTILETWKMTLFPLPCKFQVGDSWLNYLLKNKRTCSYTHLLSTTFFRLCRCPLSWRKRS